MICNKSANQICYEVVDRAVPCMLYVADILNKRVLSSQVYIINKKDLEKILAYVTLSANSFPNSHRMKLLIFNNSCSSVFSCMSVNYIISLQSLMTMCSLNPKNQPIVLLSLATHTLSYGYRTA